MRPYKSNISNNFNSIELASNSNRDLNYMSSLKVSQRLDSRLKSMMPELKGKTSQIYLTIKNHSSFEGSKSHLIHQIKQELQVPTNMEQGQIDLNSYVQWSNFDEPKQLLKQQYLDHQLYYIIVPEKHLSWAETFAKQERADSDNKKKIHVLGILKDSAYKDKIRLRSRKRIDKIPDYVHYYSMENPDCSKQIFALISQHLQGKLRQEDEHIKKWALSNKYAEKKVKRRTIHIYFDEADRQTLQNLYRKYNPKSKSSWLQIHPYASFYDIVKSIKQRQASSIKQADKANQVAQQLSSRIAQSKSHIDLGSMKSTNLLDNSQIMNSSVQAVTRLNKDDVNVIIARTDFDQIDKLKAFVKAQKLKNWDLIQIKTDSPQFYQKMAQIFQVGRDFQKQYQDQKQMSIIRSKTLYIIAQANDYYTKDLFARQDNVFHNMQFIQYNNVTDFALYLRQGVKSKDNYTVAVVPGGANTIDYEYERQIKEFMKQYKNTDFIDNFSFVSTANGQHASLLSASYQNDINTSRVYHIANNDQNWLERIMMQRDNYFHPFKGLKGSNVYILVKSTKQHLLNELREHIGQSPRLQLSTYIDKQYLAKQLETIQLKDSAIVVTDDEVLRQAQQVLVKYDEVFIMNITNRKNLKEEVKVFAWGDKHTIYNLLKQIPQIDHKLESQIYEQNVQRVSLLRENRMIPKKISFLPGNTIVVRLPANLTDQESRKMQVRLKKFFNQQIKIQYYKDPSDIRLRNKSMQPFTFNILRESELQYMKTIAKKQIQQKRQEFILFNQKPQNFRYLIEKPQFARFRFLSNSWPDIQDYIIGTVDKQGPTVSQSIYQDELIHVFVDNLPCFISNTIQQYIDYSKLKAANNTRFYYKEQIQDVLLSYPPNHKYYIVIEDNQIVSNQSMIATKRKIGEDLIEKCKKIDHNKLVQIIVINSNSRNSLKNAQNSIKCVHPDQRAAADWIASIKVYKVDYLNSRPFILIDRNSIDWYYFLNKYSHLTNQFRFAYCNSKQQMRKIIQKIRNKEPFQQIWILVKSWREYNQCLRVADKIESGRNVSILYHGDEQMKLQDHKKKMVFANENRKQVEKFILNPFRRSLHQFFPSSVYNPKVILAPVNTNYKLFQAVPLNKKQIDKWKQILHAQVFYCKDFIDLERMQVEYPDYTIYAIIDAQTQARDRFKFESIPQIKRIILNMEHNYNPRALRNNFRDSNKQIYEAAYPAQISEYLKYLRYNIRNPELQIQKIYPKELTQIYSLKSAQINDYDTMRYILAKNDSITKYQTFEPRQMRQVLEQASNYDYNTVFIGDNSVAAAVNDKNRNKNTKFKFFHASTNPPYNGSNTISQLQTNELDQIKQYIYNMPENRYDRMRIHNGKFILYYDINNQEKHYLDIIDYIRKVAQRNANVQLRGYSDARKLDAQIKESSYVLINSKDQSYYQNLLKNNINVNYLIINDQDSRNLHYYGNKYFINRHIREYYYFFDNLTESSGSSYEPLPLKLDRSIDNILRSIQNYNSEPMDDKYHKLSLHPPFRPVGSLPSGPDPQPIQFTTNLLDQNPPSINNIPFAVASPPTLPLGVGWIQKIKKHKLYVAPPISPISLPVVDIPPSQNRVRLHSQPDRNFPAMTIIPSIPKKHVQRFHLAVLFVDIPQFKSFGEMLKSNLQPEQFTVKLIGFRNQHELDEYAKGNGSRLNTFDKIVVFLTPEYRKYDQIFKTMKSRLDPRMEYFYFDDNFHAINHKILGNHLRPYRIRKMRLPYQNPNLPYYWNYQNIFNIFTPIGNRKYEVLRSQNVNIIPYNSNNQINEQMHKFGVFNLIICNRANYHNLKQFARVSPRCTLLVQDTEDLYQDQFLFYRFSSYCIYYGPTGVQFLRRLLPRQFSRNITEYKMVYFLPNDRQFVVNSNYQDYEKVQFLNYQQLYEYLVIRYKHTYYRHFLYRHTPVIELVPLNPRVYMENKDWMKQFKNNYIDVGHRHQTNSGIKSNIRIHQFSDLQEMYYSNPKDLVAMLQKQTSPCIVLINDSNNRMLGVKYKFQKWHKFISIANDFQKWIDRDGSLPDVQDSLLIKKQDMFLITFHEKVFDDYNDFQYYYLSNKADVDHKNNIYFRTKEDLEEIYYANENLLMVVFAESCDKKHIPEIILQEARKQNGRVKLVYVQPDFKNDDYDLYVKFNEIDPVIIHINKIQISGRRDFLVFKQLDGDKKRRTLIMQKSLQKIDSIPFNSMDDIDTIGNDLKGQFKKIYVICFPHQQAQIESIFQKYSIKNKPYSNQAVQYFYIDQASTLHPNNINSNIKPNPTAFDTNILMVQSKPPRSPRQIMRKSKSSQILQTIQLQSDQRYQIIPAIDQLKSEHFQDQGMKIQKLIDNKNYTLSINRKLKNQLPVGKFYARNIEYFDDVSEIPRNDSGAPHIIISNEKYDDLQNICEHSPQTMVVYVSNQAPLNPNTHNTLIISEEQVPTLIKRLQGQDDLEDQLSFRSIDDYDKIRVVYDQHLDPKEKRKLLSASYKNKKIVPTKFTDIETLSEYMKEPSSLVVLMMKQQPFGLDKKINAHDYKVVKKRRTKVLLPRRADDGIDGLQTILQQDQQDNDFIKVQNLDQNDIDRYLHIIESKPYEQRDDLIDFRYQKSKSSIKANQFIEDDQITKLNVHSNIRPEDMPLFGDDQIQKIKQRLDGNLIVLVIQHSRKDQVKDITSKYNVLVQNYTNALNLENDLRDRKDSVTIAVINKKMIDKIIPLKKKYKQVTFILENDTPQQQLLEEYRPYIAGQIKKMSDLQKIIAELYAENERIRYNEHSIRLASRFENKRPSVSVVDFSNNQKLSNAINNQKSKKAFLFYKQPQNTHVKLKLMNDVGTVVSFIPYKNVSSLKNTLGKYNSYSSIIIANGEEIDEIQDFVSRKKENAFVIRFNAPQDVRDTPRVKRLFSTYKKDDLEEYLYGEFMKIGNLSSYERLDSKFRSPPARISQVKKYTQKYQPNAFGTTPRFPGDFVPPKSMKETYSHRYMKSQSRSKMGKDEGLKSRNLYYQS